MCGRFALVTPGAELAAALGLDQVPTNLKARANIAPTQEVPVLPNLPVRRLEEYRWGLIPSWAKEKGIGNRMINARAETVAVKPAFKDALRRRRCLVPADGFYEWKAAGGKAKIPHFIRLRSHRPLAFAGLWESWQPRGSGAESGEAAVRSFTILTCAPNALMRTLHERMPVILPPAAYARWLDPAPLEPAELLPLLVPFPAEALEAYPVSLAVNNPRNQGAELMQPTSSPTPG